MEALTLFRERRLSPVELMEATLDLVEKTEPVVNAFSARYPEQALRAASLAEGRYADGSARRLEGLPVVIKELTPVAGQQHTLGSLALAENVASASAPIAQRILDAGGIVHGRTTSPEFGCASYTHSRLHGLTRNPWNLVYGPAGSSGGSAAALALGTTSLAQGTDAAGSLRLPAAACGVVGYKPPFGRVPSGPPFYFERCHHDGPMARTVGDCRLLYEVVAGVHSGDPMSRSAPCMPHTLPSLDGLRLAFMAGIAGLNVDRDVTKNLAAGVAALKDAGAAVEEVDLGWNFEQIIETTKLHFATTYAPRVQRVVDEHPGLVTRYTADFAAQEERYAAVKGFALRANEQTAELWEPLARVFERCDALICPTLAIPAPLAGEEYLDVGPMIDGVEHLDRWTVAFTVPFNLCSWTPAMNVPSGFASCGVPTGMQVVGRPYDDTTVFAIAQAFERSHPWLRRP